SSMRAIPIPAFLKEIIESFRKPELADAYFLASEPKEVIEPRIMQYRFSRYLKAAGIKKANFHALRHTFATRCV
ncbi:tyrosine-type recombinase/integrase, partial [Klebsiella pneumoniae]|uniref:tyrosine-type recombinase/integrase n=1 Tax=Klebsiella pneumoniae TaxID=573 RepID=UPI0025A08CE8